MNQSSPNKWKTEQRENYRYFVDTPTKEEQEKQKRESEILHGGESLDANTG